MGGYYCDALSFFSLFFFFDIHFGRFHISGWRLVPKPSGISFFDTPCDHVLSSSLFNRRVTHCFFSVEFNSTHTFHLHFRGILTLCTFLTRLLLCSLFL